MQRNHDLNTFHSVLLQNVDKKQTKQHVNMNAAWQKIKHLQAQTHAKLRTHSLPKNNRQEQATEEYFKEDALLQQESTASRMQHLASYMYNIMLPNWLRSNSQYHIPFAVFFGSNPLLRRESPSLVSISLLLSVCFSYWYN